MPKHLSTLTVEVYTRPGCHLCEDAYDLLEALQATRGFRLIERSIIDDPDWLARYQYRVPVVAVNGIERLALRFSRAELEAVLDERGRLGDERTRE